ncbi:SDR family NAD(P)-dependent oxidoreductase [Candidatus Accumulibacter phosphatis]|uniref:3-oxoacyl-[ACP] reductase n=1 Tax=Candidatus Accumulibacter phosphatis TaxID=327160 RepID=A0A5S4EPP3_9PROT|nr:3-oxoacyl-[ACP] reductase [Candidatus Accumulibacter phosphatis]
MIRTRWGRVVNISSVAAITDNRVQVNYSAAKGALHAASRSLTLEAASRGITGNAVAWNQRYRNGRGRFRRRNDQETGGAAPLAAATQ